MTISALYAVIDFSKTLWLYLIIHIALSTVLYKYLYVKLHNTVKPNYRALFAREWTIHLTTPIIIIVYVYIMVNDFEPSYLKDSLEETWKIASSSITSSCDVVNYLLKLQKEVDSIFWWIVENSTKNIKNNTLNITIWISFLLMNSFAILGVNRFVVQVIYLIDKQNGLNTNDTKEIKQAHQNNNSTKTMGNDEKIFWLFIIIFALAWIILQGLSYNNNKKQNIVVSKNEPVLKTVTKTIIEIVDDNQTMKNNLENSETLKLLKKNLNLKISNLNETIESQVNQAFSPVYNNIDTFLDFHYSVVGEYTELIGTATNKISTTIKDKLFGEMFNSDLEHSKEYVQHKYTEVLKEHFNQIDILATKDINKTLNSQIFSKLNEDIQHRTSVQIIKLASVIGTATAVKIIGIVTAKILAKTASKLAAKSAIKTGAKVAASSTAGTAGLSCGPFAWICSPIAATVAWFGTDAIVVSADEFMNREEFNQDIIVMLNKEKRVIIEKLQSSYANQFKKDSLAIQEDFKNTSVKKKIEKNITIKAKIFKGQ